MTSTDLVTRLKTVTGKPAATLLVEPGLDRRFLAEITFGAVVMYLAGKYLDGFIEGLGIPEFGKRHGQALATAIPSLLSMMGDATADEDREKELQQQEKTIQTVAGDLAKHKQNEIAGQKAEQTVQKLLEERGVPRGEARRIAAGIGAALLGAVDG